MANIDQRGKLEESPFDVQITKEGKALIYYQNKLVKTLKGKSAEKLASKLDEADDYEIQIILAKETGNFKRGNEKRR